MFRGGFPGFDMGDMGHEGPCNLKIQHSLNTWNLLLLAHAEKDNKYYKVMGLEPNASKDDIKKQYRKMVIKMHPDKVLIIPFTKKYFPIIFKFLEKIYF